MMNIAYFLPHLSLAEGMNRVLSIKANYLADVLGYNVTIITYRQYERPIFFEFSPNIKMVHFNIKDPSFSLHQMSFIEKLRAIRTFNTTYKQLTEKYLLQNRTDIAISMFLGAEYKFLALLKDGSKKILEFHFNFNVTQFKIFEEQYKIKNLLAQYQIRKEQKILQKFDRLIPLTNKDGETWKQYFDNITVIPNPITIQKTRDTKHQKKQAIAVGRLSSEKGFDMLIEAWKLVNEKEPDWQLNIFGDGSLSDELNKQIEKNNLSKAIKILPTTKEIAERYAEHSIFVLSSRHEGFGLGLLEAMSLGLACVSFNCNYGPEEMITDGTDGFLVEPGNIAELANRILILIENEDLRLSFGKNAMISAKRYSLEIVMEKWDSLFRAITNHTK